MDVLRFLTEGNKEPNPLYNPKTKKGAIQPPFITNSNPGQDLRDRIVSATTETSNINAYSLVGYNPEEYSDYDVYINPWNTKEELDRQRAENQGIFEQGVRAIGQTINEIGLGTVVGTFDLASIAIDAIQNDGLKYNRPEAIQYLAELKESINEAIPIYRENPNAAFDITDTGWWFSNMPTIASSLTLMVPGMAVSKGLSAVGKIGTLSAATNKAANILKLSEKTRQFLGRAGESISAGTTMRLLENYQEATQVKQDAKDYALGQLSSMNDKQRNEFITNNPEYANKTDDEIAEDIAVKSANTTFEEDWWNVMFDIYQVYGLKNLWNKALQGNNTSRLRTINRQAAAQLGDDAATIQQTIANKKFGEKALESLRNAGTAAIEGTRTEWTEGIEEAINYIAQQDGMQVAKYAFDKSTPKQTISDYLKDPHLWESAFWGVLAGVVFSAGSDAAVGYAQRKLNKEFLSAEKQKEQEIFARSNRFNNYKDSIDKIENGINPYLNEVDTAGNAKAANITDNTEKEMLKQIAKEQYFDEMIIDAIDNGNLELLEAYARDTNIAKGFREKLNLNEEDAANLQSDFIRQIEDAKLHYSNTFKTANDAGGNYEISRLVAKNIIRANRKKKLNELLQLHNENEINTIKTALNITPTDEDYSSIEKAVYYNRINKLERQRNVIANDASINNKEKAIRLKEIDDILKEYKKFEPVGYRNENGNIVVKDIIDNASKIKNNYPDLFNALYKKYDTNLNIKLSEAETDTSLPNIKKQVKQYKDAFNTAKQNIIRNALAKRDKLYRQYGDALGTDIMTEEDAKSYKEITDILNAADITKETLLSRELEIDKQQQLKEELDENKSEEISENTPTDEELAEVFQSNETDTSSTGSLTERTKPSTETIEPSTNTETAPPPTEADLTGTGATVDMGAVPFDESVPPPDDEDEALPPPPNEIPPIDLTDKSTTEEAPAIDDNGTLPVEGGTIQTNTFSSDLVEQAKQINDAAIDFITNIPDEYLANADYLDAQKTVFVNNIISKGGDATVATNAINNIINALTGNTDTVSDTGTLLSSISDENKAMMINSALGIIRYKAKRNDKAAANIISVIDAFVNSKDNKGDTRGIEHNGKKYFSAERLITYLYETVNEPIIRDYLFEAIKKYVKSKNNTAYVLTDDSKLLSLSNEQFAAKIEDNVRKRLNLVRKQIPNNVHIEFDNIDEIANKQYEALINLQPNEKLITTKVDSRLYIKTINGDNLGYMGIPIYDNKTGSYHHTNRNWIYDITIDEHGNAVSKLADFIKDMFANYEYRGYLLDLIDNGNNYTDAQFDELYEKVRNYKNGNTFLAALPDDYDNVVWAKNNAMMHLKRVIARAINDGNFNESIDNWFNTLANSYAQVIRYAEDNIQGDFYVSEVNKGSLLLNDERSNDIVDIPGYNNKTFKLYTVIDNGVIQFSDETSPRYESGFRNKGVTLLAVDNGHGGFDSAQTEQIKLTDKDKIIIEAKTELRKAFNDYLNGIITDADMANIIKSLFASNFGLFNNNKFEIIFPKDLNRATIAIKYKGQGGQYYFNISGASPNGTYSRNLNERNKTLTDKKYNIYSAKDTDKIKEFVDNLFSDVTIAIPYSLINDAKVSIANTNRYYKRENNKTIISIGGFTSTNDSYADFLIQNKFIKTKLRTATKEDGIAYGIYKMDNNTSLDIVFRETYTATTSVQLNSKVDESLFNKEGSIVAYDILIKEFAGNEKALAYIKFIRENGLLPNNVIFSDAIIDINENPIYGKYENGNIYINKKRLANMDYRNLIRTVVHESLHFQLANNYNKNDVLNKIEIVYNKFIKYLENNKEELTNKNIYDTLIKFTNRGDTYETTDEKRRETNIEEFLVESLTNGDLMTALNNIPYGTKDTKMTNKKSLLRRLLEIIADALGITINKDSLLYEEISILKDIAPINNNSFKDTKQTEIKFVDNIATKKDVSDNAEVKLPVKDEQIETDKTTDAITIGESRIEIIPDINDVNTNDNLNLDDGFTLDDNDNNILYSTVADNFTPNTTVMLNQITPSLQPNFGTLLADGTITMHC